MAAGAPTAEAVHVEPLGRGGTVGVALRLADGSHLLRDGGGGRHLLPVRRPRPGRRRGRARPGRSRGRAHVGSFRRDRWPRRGGSNSQRIGAWQRGARRIPRRSAGAGCKVASVTDVRMSRLYLLFFLSGASGLIYQIVWVRELGNVFGNTVHSASLVIAVFMLGLGAGSYVAGRWADRRYAAHPDSLLASYGRVEAAIGALGLLISLGLPPRGALERARLTCAARRLVRAVRRLPSPLRRVGGRARAGDAPHGAALTLLIRHGVRGTSGSPGAAMARSRRTPRGRGARLLPDRPRAYPRGRACVRLVAVASAAVAAAGACGSRQAREATAIDAPRTRRRDPAGRRAGGCRRPRRDSSLTRRPHRRASPYPAVRWASRSSGSAMGSLFGSRRERSVADPHRDPCSGSGWAAGAASSGPARSPALLTCGPGPVPRRALAGLGAADIRRVLVDQYAALPAYGRRRARAARARALARPGAGAAPGATGAAHGFRVPAGQRARAAHPGPRSAPRGPPLPREHAGAVAGALVAGFVLIPWLGMQRASPCSRSAPSACSRSSRRAWLAPGRRESRSRGVGVRRGGDRRARARGVDGAAAVPRAAHHLAGARRARAF
jgi:hypothetical protein